MASARAFATCSVGMSSTSLWLISLVGESVTLRHQVTGSFGSLELTLLNDREMTHSRIVLLQGGIHCALRGIKQDKTCVSTASHILNLLFLDRDYAIGTDVSLDGEIGDLSVTICGALERGIEVRCRILELRLGPSDAAIG